MTEIEAQEALVGLLELDGNKGFEIYEVVEAVQRNTRWGAEHISHVQNGMVHFFAGGIVRKVHGRWSVVSAANVDKVFV